MNTKKKKIAACAIIIVAAALIPSLHQKPKPMAIQSVAQIWSLPYGTEVTVSHCVIQHVEDDVNPKETWLGRIFKGKLTGLVPNDRQYRNTMYAQIADGCKPYSGDGLPDGAIALKGVDPDLVRDLSINFCQEATVTGKIEELKIPGHGSYPLISVSDITVRGKKTHVPK